MFKTMKNRNFYPDNFDILNKDVLKKEFDELLKYEFKSFKEYEEWIYKVDEFMAIFEESYAKCYAESTCDTENKDVQERLHFITNKIFPMVAPLGNEIDKKFLASPYLDKLNKKDFEVKIRSDKKSIELFREENVPIEAELMNLNQEYRKIMGSLMVEFEGNEYTPQQLNKFLLDNNRDIREKAFYTERNRFKKENKKISELFKQMFDLRIKSANNAGFDNYRDFRFKELGIFDYTPKDCYGLHDSIKEYVLPIKRDMDEVRKNKLNIDHLRPWDMQVDINQKEPLKPFNSIKELVDGVGNIFGDIKPLFGQNFNYLNDNAFFDLDSRKGKAPGGYMMPLKETGAAFIFMNGANQHSDVITMLHEGGHAMHFLQSKKLKLKQNQMGPSEISEVASMSMELLGIEGLKYFYSGDNLLRAKKENLERMINLFPPIAKCDAFQHYIYTNPGLSIDDICDYWEFLNKGWNTGIDWSGIEGGTRFGWQHVGHFFFSPFYMLDYAIAGLGALQVYKNYLDNPDNGIANYFKGLHFGGSRPLPELFDNFGIKFDFSPSTVKPLIESLHNEYKKY